MPAAESLCPRETNATCMIRNHAPLWMLRGTNAQISLRIPQKLQVAFREEHDRALPHECAVSPVECAFYRARDFFLEHPINKAKERACTSQKLFNLADRKQVFLRKTFLGHVCLLMGKEQCWGIL